MAGGPGSEIFKNIEERVAAELDAYGSPSPMPPISWTESQARVHARDEERKRQIARRERARQQRNHQAAYQDPATLPGASLTRLSDQSVFWMHMEDYFRDLIPEDFNLLLPNKALLGDPARDEAFTVPFLGREGASRSIHPPLALEPGATLINTCADDQLLSICTIAKSLGLLDAKTGTSTRAQAEAAIHKIASSEGKGKAGSSRSTESTSWVDRAAQIFDRRENGSRANHHHHHHHHASTSSASNVHSQHTSKGFSHSYVHPMVNLMLEKPPNSYVKRPSSQKLALPAVQPWSEGLHHLLGLPLGSQQPLPPSQAPSIQGTPAGSLLRGVADKAHEGEGDQDGHQSRHRRDFSDQNLEGHEAVPDLASAAMEELSSRVEGEGDLGLTMDGSSHGHRSRASLPHVNYSLLSGKKQKLDGGEARGRGRGRGRGPGRPSSAHPHPRPGGGGGGAGALGSLGAGPPLNLLGPSSSSYPAALAFTGALFSRCSGGSRQAPLPLPLLPLSEEELAQVAAVNPLVAANAALILAGEEEEEVKEQEVACNPKVGMEGQWKKLDNASGTLAMAPDDEVLAELLACQSELMQQVAVNRERSHKVMARALDDVPSQRQRREAFKAMEADVVAYLHHKAELKRQQRKEMRELQKRQAMGLAGLLVEGASGPALGLPAIPPELQSTLVDPYTTRGAHEDSLCVVCGDGMSAPPNQILYCERCEIPVHQHCYGLGNVPAGEWLCWPCLMHENELAAKGVPPNEIRPPKWAKDGTSGAGAGPSNAKSAPHAGPASSSAPSGGFEDKSSINVSCCLCPIKRGAFKRTVPLPGQPPEWVHLVCALWHPETTVAAGSHCDVVANRWACRAGSLCSICQLPHGAVVKCNHGQCQTFFHPLCGRREGHYCPVKTGQGGKLVYRSYCLLHSDDQRQKDSDDKVHSVPINLVHKPKVAYSNKAKDEYAGLGSLLAFTSAMEGLEGLEKEYNELHGVRLELDSLRIMADQLRKREKLKRSLAKITEDLCRMKMERHLRAGGREGLPLDPRIERELEIAEQAAMEADRLAREIAPASEGGSQPGGSSSQPVLPLPPPPPPLASCLVPPPPPPPPPLLENGHRGGPLSFTSPPPPPPLQSIASSMSSHAQLRDTVHLVPPPPPLADHRSSPFKISATGPGGEHSYTTLPLPLPPLNTLSGGQRPKIILRNSSSTGAATAAAAAAAASRSLRSPPPPPPLAASAAIGGHEIIPSPPPPLSAGSAQRVRTSERVRRPRHFHDGAEMNHLSSDGELEHEAVVEPRSSKRTRR